MSSGKLLLSCAAIMAIGLIGGIAGSYTAASEIFTTRFEVPCYVKPFVRQAEAHAISVLNCCGAFQNVSRDAAAVCTAYDNFYS